MEVDDLKFCHTAKLYADTIKNLEPSWFSKLAAYYFDILVRKFKLRLVEPTSERTMDTMFYRNIKYTTASLIESKHYSSCLSGAIHKSRILGLTSSIKQQYEGGNLKNDQGALREDLKERSPSE